MRIVDVAEFYAPNGGGVRTYIDRKFIAAGEAGHELFVIAPGAADGFDARPGGGVLWVKAPSLPFDSNYRMFGRAEPVHAHLDRLRPDVVEASSPWRGAWIVAAWRGPTLRALFAHADPVASYPQRWFAPYVSPQRIDRLFEPFWAYHRALSVHFDLSVAGSAWMARRLQAHGVPRVASIPLGADVSAFSPRLFDPQVRAQLLAACGLPSHGRILLGVGRHHAQKRWPMVIAAVKAAARASGQPIGVAVIGAGMDRARIARAAARYPHASLMEPTRDRAALAARLASADSLIHGSESETFGLVVAEAVASGLPVIAPDRGACAELAAPNASALYRAADARSASAAIVNLLGRDRTALRAAAVAAAPNVQSDRDHYAALFSRYERDAPQPRISRAQMLSPAFAREAAAAVR